MLILPHRLPSLLRPSLSNDQSAPELQGDAGPSEHDVENKIQELTTSIENIPLLREGFVRLVHITKDLNSVRSILTNGLDYSQQGMLMSTARAFADNKDVRYYSDDPRYSGKGAAAVIMDILQVDLRLHNDPTRSPGVVPERYVVAVVDVSTAH